MPTETDKRIALLNAKQRLQAKVREVEQCKSCRLSDAEPYKSDIAAIDEILQDLENKV